MMNGKEKINDKFDKELLSTINDAILKQKYRIVKRTIVDNVDSFSDPTYKVQYAIQIGHKFLFWYWWEYAEKDSDGFAIWRSSLNYCKKWIYNKCICCDDKIKIVGLLPSE